MGLAVLPQKWLMADSLDRNQEIRSGAGGVMSGTRNPSPKHIASNTASLHPLNAPGYLIRGHIRIAFTCASQRCKLLLLRNITDVKDSNTDNLGASTFGQVYHHC
jgi:hypothetical protein